MMTPPRPRPWMPLCRRRFVLDYSVVPRTVLPSVRDEDGRPRSLSPTAALARRRGLLRRHPSARDLRLRIDQLAAEAGDWIAELQERSRGPRSNA